MRSMYRAVLVVCAAALVMGAVTASSAFATPEWEAKAPEWQQGGAALSKSAATTWKGTLKWTDAAGGIFSEAATVECEDGGEGSSGPGAVDEETKWSFSKCTSKAIGCETPTVEAVGLPWHTALVLSSGSARDVVSESGKGTPGFKVSCLGLGSDTCSGALAAGVTNVATGVDAALVGTKLKCTRGGEGKGTVEGTQLIEAVSGGKLEVNSAFSKLASSLEVKGTGQISITDTKFSSFRATCNIETAGTIEAHGLGKITSYLAKGCGEKKAKGECAGSLTAEPINLPWKTELFESGAQIRERIVSGGAGAPAWRLSCEGTEDTCELNTTLGMGNSTEGWVDAAFDGESNKASCSAGGKAAGAWEGVFKFTHPTSVEAILVKK